MADPHNLVELVELGNERAKSDRLSGLVSELQTKVGSTETAVVASGSRVKDREYRTKWKKAKAENKALRARLDAYEVQATAAVDTMMEEVAGSMENLALVRRSSSGKGVPPLAKNRVTGQ